MRTSVLRKFKDKVGQKEKRSTAASATGDPRLPSANNDAVTSESPAPQQQEGVEQVPPSVNQTSSRKTSDPLSENFSSSIAAATDTDVHASAHSDSHREHRTSAFSTSIWLEAYLTLDNDDQKILSEACPLLQSSLTRETNSHLLDNIPSLANEVVKNVELAKKRRDEHHPKLKQGFDITVRMLNQCKGLITEAASFNPYSAAAVAVAGSVLPLLLLPGEELQHAVKLLGSITHLIVVYRWAETNYGSKADFRGKLVALYGKILRAEIDLFTYFCRRSWLHNAGDSLVNKGKWEDHLKGLQDADDQCQDLSEQLRENATQVWRVQESETLGNMSRTLDDILRDQKETKAAEQMRRLDSNYRRARDQNPPKVRNTCNWFLRHPDFLEWRNSSLWRLLWLSADPGCGKSVLSRSLVECHATLLSPTATYDGNRIVCYFFFKDGQSDKTLTGQPTHAARAVGALIHQMLLQEPKLYQHLLQLLKRNDDVIKDAILLWELLLGMLRDPILQGRQVVCVLDALDECEPDSRIELTQQLVQAFDPRTTAKIAPYAAIFKVIATSRPYTEIEQGFSQLIGPLPQIHLRGEEEGENIEKEIRLVVEHEVLAIGPRIGLKSSGMDMLREKLLSVENKTYLWLHLVWEYLQFSDIDRRIPRMFLTNGQLKKALEELPVGIHDVYDRLLSRTPDEATARTLLHIVLAASEPLKVTDAYYALQIGIDESIKSYADIDDGLDNYSDEEVMIQASRLKNLCGLLIHVTSDRYVALLHQTVREYLESSSMPRERGLMRVYESNVDKFSPEDDYGLDERLEENLEEDDSDVNLYMFKAPREDSEEDDNSEIEEEEKKTREDGLVWRHQFSQTRSKTVLSRICLRALFFADIPKEAIQHYASRGWNVRVSPLTGALEAKLNPGIFEEERRSDPGASVNRIISRSFPFLYYICKWFWADTGRSYDLFVYEDVEYHFDRLVRRIDGPNNMLPEFMSDLDRFQTYCQTRWGFGDLPLPFLMKRNGAGIPC